VVSELSTFTWSVKIIYIHYQMIQDNSNHCPQREYQYKVTKEKIGTPKNGFIRK